MNRKTKDSNTWVFHQFKMSPNDEEWTQQHDEEYNGNYTFIVIEDNKKKCKKYENNNNLQLDTNYEDE